MNYQTQLGRRARLSGTQAAFIIAIAAIVTGDASAQNALGDGSALDNNLRVGSDRRNTRTRDFAAQLRYQNAIATGNAPGGLSFRGSLGYSAVDDFRADLGSNDLFDFERDSLYSGFSALGFRGIDALRQQTQLAIGGVLDESTGLPIARRAGTGASVTSLNDQSRMSAGQAGPANYDPFALKPGSLRSSSASLVGTALSPRRLGVGGDENDRTYVVASPLRGVVYQSAPDYPGAMLSTGAAIDLHQTDADEQRDASPNALQPDKITGKVEKLETSGAINGRVESTRVDYQRLTEELRRSFLETSEQSQAASKSAVDVNEDARVQPTAPGATPSGDATDSNIDANEQTKESIFDQRLGELQKHLRDLRSDPNESPSDARRRADREALMRDATALLGRATPTLQTFAPSGSKVKGLYLKQMRIAQEELAARRWFVAEERFSTALRMSPGDPMAAAGRINAQLGAAMFRSAAFNLKHLLIAHPDLASVRFAPELFPDANRMDVLAEYLREKAADETEFGKDAGLMLAYIGRQRNNQADLNDGFGAIDRIVNKLGDDPDPLIDMLRAVWLK